MKYVATSAVLRFLFSEPGRKVSFKSGDHVVSSRLLEVEAFRAVDRERLLGNLDDAETAVKRKELVDLLKMLDLVPVDDALIDGANGAGGVRGRSRPS
ncbi:MAG TPA: hypothetical protein VI172_10930 [Candidatus Dormibacteraeota bacterium]